MTDTTLTFDEQHEFYLKYQIDPIELGSLIKQYPSLEKSWAQFKTVYNLVRKESQ